MTDALKPAANGSIIHHIVDGVSYGKQRNGEIVGPPYVNWRAEFPIKVNQKMTPSLTAIHCWKADGSHQTSDCISQSDLIEIYPTKPEPLPEPVELWVNWYPQDSDIFSYASSGEALRSLSPSAGKTYRARIEFLEALS